MAYKDMNEYLQTIIEIFEKKILNQHLIML